MYFMGHAVYPVKVYSSKVFKLKIPQAARSSQSWDPAPLVRMPQSSEKRARGSRIVTSRRGTSVTSCLMGYCASRAVSVGNLQLELTSRDDCTARVKKRYLWAPSAEPFLTETGRYWGVSLTPAVLQPSL